MDGMIVVVKEMLRRRPERPKRWKAPPPAKEFDLGGILRAERQPSRWKRQGSSVKMEEARQLQWTKIRQRMGKAPGDLTMAVGAETELGPMEEHGVGISEITGIEKTRMDPSARAEETMNPMKMETATKGADLLR